jgi:hypothetical protein
VSSQRGRWKAPLTGSLERLPYVVVVIDLVYPFATFAAFA